MDGSPHTALGAGATRQHMRACFGTAPLSRILVVCYEWPPVGGGGGRVAAVIAGGGSPEARPRGAWPSPPR